MSIEVPPELFAEWLAKGRARYDQPGLIAGFVAKKAAEWADDQRLDACCKAIVEQIITIDNTGFSSPAGVLHMESYSSWPAFAQMVSRQLRTAMRPKPLSKVQALIEFDELMSELDGKGDYSNCAGRIRRALESIPDADS